jgi:hypothetical protein
MEDLLLNEGAEYGINLTKWGKMEDLLLNVVNVVRNDRG